MSTPSGTIHLIRSAPVDISYQHSIDFKDPQEQEAFWGSLAIENGISLTEYSYIRRDRRSISIERTFDQLEGVNYLFYNSREQEKTFYAFVTDREYINDRTTRLYFDIDVFQTFLFDYKFRPSYISQAHVDRWNAEKLPIYSRTEENLSYGTEYETESAYKIGHPSWIPHGFYLIYVKPAEEDPPTISPGNPTPYSIYMIPNIEKHAPDSIFAPSKVLYGGTVLSGINEFMSLMANSSVGNLVAQISYLKYLPIPYDLRLATEQENSDTGADYVLENIDGVSDSVFLKYFSLFIDKKTNFPGSSTTFNVLKIRWIGNSSNDSSVRKTIAKMGTLEGIEEYPTPELWESVKAKPGKTERDRRFESKLLCYPYRYNIFTDWVNAPLLIKNEYLSPGGIKINQSIGIGFNTPKRFWVEGYLKDTFGRDTSISNALPFEQPVINDAYYTYLLQNKNQISANLTNAKINAISGTVTGALNGVAGGLATGGFVGAFLGAIGGAVSSGVQGALDVQEIVRNENAKQADLQAIPDTIGASNDITLAINDDNTSLTLYRKRITCEFREQLAQYWHCYGYKLNRVDVPNLRSRYRFNYIKTIGANITGDMESPYLSALKAIFDRGITIWHYLPNDFYPLDYTYENMEVNLLA